MNMFPHTVTVYNHIGESIETGLPESKINDPARRFAGNLAGRKHHEKRP